MNHNRKRLLRWTAARTPWVRAVRAWRNLLPDWTPSLDELVALETAPHEHRAVVRVISDGWEPNDPRWDCLMALLEYERRQALMRQALENVSWISQEEWEELNADHDDVSVSEDHVAWDPEGTVPNLREVHPQAEDVQPDPEPVQQEQGDGKAENRAGDTGRGSPASPGMVTGSTRVFHLRTIRSIREQGDKPA